MKRTPGLIAMLAVLILLAERGATAQSIPGTKALTEEGDLASKMVSGIDNFLLRQLDQSVEQRAKLWKRDLSSAEAYNKSVAANRQHLAKIVGAVDPRVDFADLELIAPLRMRAASGRIGASESFEAVRVRWPVLKGVDAEGLLLLPRGLRPHLADCIAIPDADQSPEQLAGLVDAPDHVQWAKRLAENGCRVLIPTIISRSDKFSASAGGERKLDQTHRELLYRPAFEMGRHVIGYEVQKVLAGVDWLAKQPRGGRAIGVVGYGEGGLLALYSAALDARIDVCGVSGYFDSRQHLWQEPIYRNVNGLLREFGDAELASLVAPRGLIVEACAVPKINNVGPVREGRPPNTAAPGVLATPPTDRVKGEFDRAATLVKGLKLARPWEFVASGDGQGPQFSEKALAAIVASLIPEAELRPAQGTPLAAAKELDLEGRQKRQLEQMLEHTQALLRESEYVRAAKFKVNTSVQGDGKLAAYNASAKPLREQFYNDVIGRFELPLSAANVRTRQIYDEPKFTGHEVVMDVLDSTAADGKQNLPATVIGYGILLLPKELKKGERRPVVVCQHGLEGRPQDVAHPASQKENPAYNNYAAKLAERGFITYAPQNPYIFWDRFRTLQRKANPLGKSLFSIIIPQHQQLVRWLGGLQMVDPERIAFYGLSYGGKTAMRVPAVVEEYCLSICSADFNEWVWKNASLRSRYSYVGTMEYEIFEFDLGHTFNYAEMAGLIAPRGFMVERGHRDGVAPDEAVAYEYAKVRRLYADLKIPDRTTIEFFDGPHTIHGVGTFDFLHQQLKWAKR